MMRGRKVCGGIAVGAIAAGTLLFSGSLVAGGTPPPGAPGKSPPVNVAPPTVSGTAQVGSTLSGGQGTWSSNFSVSFAYQWLRCDSGADCAPIGDATATTYSPVAADVGHTLRFAVTATNKNGSTSASSAQTAAVQAAPAAPTTLAPPANTAAPTVSGSPVQGQTLTAAPGTWTGTQPVSYAYQWQRCSSTGGSCTSVTGATGQSYTLGQADVLSTVRVQVTASNTVGSAAAVSAVTAVVTAPTTTTTTTISPNSLPSGTVGVAYSQQLTASGPSSSYRFKLSAGALPSGIALSSSGLLSGTPSAAGSFSFTVSVLDSTGATAASHAYGVSIAQAPAKKSGSTLKWAPPTLSNPTTITVPDTGGQVRMDSTKDYIVKVGHLSACGGLWLEGGHNVVVIGGHVTIPTACASSYDRSGVKVRFNTGIVHLEGLLIDGAYLLDGIDTSAPQATLQVENVRIVNAHTTTTDHPDCLQTQAGLGALRVDHFTCSTQLQGFFLKDESSTVCHLGPCEIDNANIVGAPGKYLFWQDTPDIGPLTLSNVWLSESSGSTDLGMWVWPNKNAEGQSNPNRRAVVSSDGSYCWFINSNISGTINKGSPPGGDFVPNGVAGENYVSPGYGG
jgi:Putative Ig domain